MRERKGGKEIGFSVVVFVCLSICFCFLFLFSFGGGGGGGAREVDNAIEARMIRVIEYYQCHK